MIFSSLRGGAADKAIQFLKNNKHIIFWIAAILAMTMEINLLVYCNYFPHTDLEIVKYCKLILL
jgi:hypothetical protein